MSSPQKDLLRALNVVTAIVIVIVIAVLGSRKTPLPTPAASSSGSASGSSAAPSASLSAQPQASATEVPSKPRQAPLPAEAFMQSAVGAWEGPDGTRLYVDPARPAASKKPRFHLILERQNKSGFGCDFEATNGPELAEFDLTFRAWCGGEAKGKRRTMMGLGMVDGKLKFGLLVDATPMHHTLWSRRPSTAPETH